MRRVPTRLAAALGRARWLVLALWLAATVLAGIAAAPLADQLDDGGWSVPGSSSALAAAAAQQGFDGRDTSNATLVVRDERNQADSPAFARRVGDVLRAQLADPRLRVSGSYGWSDTDPATRPRFVGADRRTAITQLGLDLPEGAARRVLPLVQHDLDQRYPAQGLRVALVSAGAFFGEVNELSQHGLATAELITLPLVLVILYLLYRNVRLTVLSLLTGVTAIGWAFGLLAVIAQWYDLSLFVQSAVTMIGLGVSIDYSLFVISRYVEEYSRSRDRAAALAATLRSSGATVLFAGLVAALGTCALLLIDLNAIRSIAIGVVVVVGCAVVAAGLVLPTVLYLLGERCPQPRKLREPADGRRWDRLARRVMARPFAFLAVAGLGTLLLAAPAIRLDTFTPDAGILPGSSSVRTGYDTINQQFGAGTAAPIVVVARSDRPLPGSAAADQLSLLRGTLAGLPGARRVDPPAPVLAAGLRGADPGSSAVAHYLSADRRTAVLEVVPDGDASAERTRTLLDAVRAATGALPDRGLAVAVGGETAEGVDANAAIQDRLPLVLLAIAVLTYLLLLVIFRSVFLPLKAIAMNLLSLAAAYGTLVLVFQWGHGAALLSDAEFGHVQNFVPILLLVILFSLSTDYEVFLLTRIRESHLAGAPDTTSVATGLARTAPLISGAALLMFAVFGAFTLAAVLPIQQLGFGLAVGIAIDATLIRLIVVPAAMRLMGRWNWWLPGRRAPAAPQATSSTHTSAGVP